ncbi:MAG: 5-formyltetrahydrofolate cyclo-ligase [Acidimicrobiia bacterium]
MPRTKAEWRQWAGDILPASEVESAAVCEIVLQALRRHSVKVVLTFLAMRGEIDLACLQNDPALVLGVTRTPPRGPLTIHRLEGSLEMHPFGYLQPAANAELMDAAEIEAVLVPGVLFSAAGARLGHGRGYYDQLLSGLPGQPRLIGITVDRRVVDELPMTKTDVWMDSIATETGYRETGGMEA